METRNRKPLIRPIVFEAEWELRFGPKNRFQAFYTVRPERGEVNVLAIGEKVGNRLLVGGKEIQV